MPALNRPAGPLGARIASTAHCGAHPSYLIRSIEAAGWSVPGAPKFDYTLVKEIDGRPVYVWPMNLDDLRWWWCGFQMGLGEERRRATEG